ncbi:DUF4280 domain-containing protein [Chryseobacterium sp. G0186]|uniref:PAAR-like protein n=1 Tax=Chryseobacterium sp. G0186 TaxID=2487064 RepID=UPI000F4EF7DF|nr:PAAR-like protein [Chryseobacterium sp. G0186]AZA79545.1 DUF4280 domain-containing protein [Chryseobacterium sp. G0186]
MSKLYVPDGAWLVCSKGMKKQQIKVTSQSTVTIAGGYLKATVDDRPGGNFICGKMMLFGAVAGLVVGAAFVVGTVATGGALAIGAGATIAAAAAGGAALGGIAALVPSICGMLLKDWTPYDKDVLTVGKNPLLESSQIPCRFGGNVIILYSEKAADEMTDVIIGDTAIGVLGTIAFGYIMGPAMKALGTAAGTAHVLYKTFGFIASRNYVSGVVGAGIVAYSGNEVLNKGKEYLYDQVPLPGTERTYGDYVKGFDTDVEKLKDAGLQKQPDSQYKSPTDLANDMGSASDMGQKAVGDRTSSFEQHRTTRFVRLDDIVETGSTSNATYGRIPNSIEGRAPVIQPERPVVINQDYGGRYQEGYWAQTTNNTQYDRLKASDALRTGGSAALHFGKDQISRPGFDKDGTKGGGLYFGLIQDMGKAVSNFLLEGQAKDVLEAMQNEEAAARKSITVLAGRD